jgi:hypothetical protein
MTAELRNWIIRNDLATTPSREVRERLSDQVEIHRDSQRWTMAGVMDILGPEAVITMERKLRAADLGVFSQALASGIQFDTDSTRGALMMCVQMGVLSAEEVQAMLDIGLRYGPVWQKVGLKELPSESEIEAVQATIATEQEQELIAQAYQRVRKANLDGEKDPEQWVALFREVVTGEWVDEVEDDEEDSD